MDKSIQEMIETIRISEQMTETKARFIQEKREGERATAKHLSQLREQRALLESEQSSTANRTAEQRVRLQELVAREKILKEATENSQKELDKEQKLLDEERNKSWEGHEEGFEAVRKFNEKYGLFAIVERFKQREITPHVCPIKTDNETLNPELSMSASQEYRLAAEKEIETEIEILEKTIRNKRTFIETLKAERDRLQSEPSTGHEFQRLEAELKQSIEAGNQLESEYRKRIQKIKESENKLREVSIVKSEEKISDPNQISKHLPKSAPSTDINDLSYKVSMSFIEDIEKLFSSTASKKSETGKEVTRKSNRESWDASWNGEKGKVITSITSQDVKARVQPENCLSNSTRGNESSLNNKGILSNDSNLNNPRTMSMTANLIASGNKNMSVTVINNKVLAPEQAKCDTQNSLERSLVPRKISNNAPTLAQKVRIAKVKADETNQFQSSNFFDLNAWDGHQKIYSSDGENNPKNVTKLNIVSVNSTVTINDLNSKLNTGGVMPETSKTLPQNVPKYQPQHREALIYENWPNNEQNNADQNANKRKLDEFFDKYVVGTSVKQNNKNQAKKIKVGTEAAWFAEHLEDKCSDNYENFADHGFEHAYQAESFKVMKDQGMPFTQKYNDQIVNQRLQTDKFNYQMKRLDEPQKGTSRVRFQLDGNAHEYLKSNQPASTTEDPILKKYQMPSKKPVVLNPAVAPTHCGAKTSHQTTIPQLWGKMKPPVFPQSDSTILKCRSNEPAKKGCVTPAKGELRIPNAAFIDKSKAAVRKYELKKSMYHSGNNNSNNVEDTSEMYVAKNSHNPYTMEFDKTQNIINILPEKDFQDVYPDFDTFLEVGDIDISMRTGNDSGFLVPYTLQRCADADCEKRFNSVGPRPPVFKPMISHPVTPQRHGVFNSKDAYKISKDEEEMLNDNLSEDPTGNRKYVYTSTGREADTIDLEILVNNPPDDTQQASIQTCETGSKKEDCTASSLYSERKAASLKAKHQWGWQDHLFSLPIGLRFIKTENETNDNSRVS